METTLYADILFLVNFSMDFISLWAAALLMSSRRSALRMSLASAIGALYGVISVIIGMHGIPMYISAAAVSVLMCLTAFGVGSGIWDVIRHSALIWGCGALLGGTMTAIISLSGNSYTASGNKTGSPWTLLFASSAALVYLTVRIIRRKKRRRSADVTVEYRGKSITFHALCDSGNLLRDPISGDCVIPVSDRALKLLVGDAVCTALEKCDTDVLEKQRLSVRIIPRKSADGTSLICAMIPDKTTIVCDSKRRAVSCLIAPMPLPKDYFGGFSATVSSDLVP